MRSLICAAVLLLCAAGAARAERLALVIGNAAYAGVARLANPGNDAHDMAGALRRLGFRVVLLTDAPQQAMRRALADFAHAAAGADMAVIYFAGHGMETRGENFLIPVDAELRTERDLPFQAIRLGEVIETVAEARRFGLVVLDACRDDPFRARMEPARDGRRGLGRGLARVDPPRGAALVAYAAREGTTAEDGRGRNSPFTLALMQHIEKPGLEVADLFREVRSDVMEATGRRQDPTVYGQLGRERVYLAGAAPPPVRIEGPTAREAAFWAAIEQSTEPRDFQLYFAAFPDGHFAAQAAERLRAARAARQAALEPPRPPAPAPMAMSPPQPMARPPAPAAAQPDAGSLDLAFWSSIQGSRDPRDYEAYLAAFPQGRFAALARTRLEWLGSAAASAGRQPLTDPAADPRAREQAEAARRQPENRERQSAASLQAAARERAREIELERQRQADLERLRRERQVAAGGAAARALVESYFAAWSSTEEAALGFVRTRFAPELDAYFGAPASRESVLEDKRPFLTRWPERRWTLRAETLSVACVELRGRCTVSGQVEWEARSAARDAAALGLSEFTIEVAFPQGRPPEIAAERSSVLARAR